MAINYWCYLLDVDRIVAGFIIKCGTDSAALEVAGRALEALPCTAAEVWDRERKLSTISKMACGYLDGRTSTNERLSGRRQRQPGPQVAAGLAPLDGKQCPPGAKC